MKLINILYNNKEFLFFDGESVFDYTELSHAIGNNAEMDGFYLDDGFIVSEKRDWSWQLLSP